jgi:hypothetical protein
MVCYHKEKQHGKREYMKSKLFVLTAAIIAVLASAIAVPVSAQRSSGSTTQNSSANSLRVAPVRTDIALDPGASKEITVYAQNLAPTPVQVKAVVSDFEASRDESGQPMVILDDKYAESHSLKRLAKVEPELVTLAPNVRTPVKLKITIPSSARAGGYYGVVRFLPANAIEQDDSGVAISANLGSLVILKVNGDVEEKMTLASMDVRQNDKAGGFFKSNKDIKTVIRFNNEGNIQLQPFGKVQLKDRSGKIIEEHEVNNTDPRGNVLPESIRRFEVDLKKVGSFGKYTVEGNFGYGTKGELLTSSASFWVVPTTYIIGGVIGLIFLGGIGFLIFKVVSLSRRSRGGHARRY